MLNRCHSMLVGVVAFLATALAIAAGVTPIA